VNPAVDRELESIIATATASQPGNRFADCLEFKVELETYIRTRSLN
jgi:hypothetical protein